MTAHERKRRETRPRKDDEPVVSPPEEDAAHEEPAKAESHANSSPGRQRFETQPPGARIWALPTYDGEVLAVVEDGKAEALAPLVETQPPVIVCAEGNAGDYQELVECASRAVDTTLRDRVHDSAFSFLKRTLVSGACLVAGLFALRIPGKFRIFDELMIVGSFGYLCYAVARYGYQTVRWHNRRVDARNAFAHARFEKSTLAERLAAALTLRKNLKGDARGQSPDDELLDTNAYRKLVKDGVTTAQELSKLGRAIEERFGLNEPGNKERKIGEIAAATGIDTNTAIFYRDLAHAAAEIRLDAQVAEIE